MGSNNQELLRIRMYVFALRQCMGRLCAPIICGCRWGACGTCYFCCRSCLDSGSLGYCRSASLLPLFESRQPSASLSIWLLHIRRFQSIQAKMAPQCCRPRPPSPLPKNAVVIGHIRMCHTVWQIYGLYLWPWVGCMDVTTFPVTFLSMTNHICTYMCTWWE